MKGKIVNFCMALLNLCIGIAILIYIFKVPKDITELTVQEYNIIKITNIIIYIGISLGNLLNTINYFFNRQNSIRKTGYLFAIFSISFILIKEWPISIFSFIATFIIVIATFRERWIERNSITIISIIGIILIFVLVSIGMCFSYKKLGIYILKKENEHELAYKQDYFKYITELDIQDIYINIKKDGKYGYITPNGNTVIDFKYDYASPFVNIKMYNKNFQIALVCENGSTEVIMKNLRKVMTYRSESMDEDYESKIHELENVYYNILNQTEKMKFEVNTDYNSIYKISVYEEQLESGILRFDYNNYYDILVSKSSLGFGDTYYLVSKNDSSFKLKLECENLDYDDKYLYIFSDGTIPFYDITVKKQGWFTETGNKKTLSGKAQILEIFGEKILIKNHNDNTIYFINNKNEKISEIYKEIFICGYDRFIVKNSRNKYMVIDSNFEKIFESEWDFVDTSLVQIGIFVFGNTKDWNVEFNNFDFVQNMNLTMIDYMGNILIEGVQQSYNKYYYILRDDTKSNSQLYSEFLEDLKIMKCNYIGDKFYKKGE